MQKYFDLLLELLRPEEDDFMMDEKKKLSAVWEKIENRWRKKRVIIPPDIFPQTNAYKVGE